MTDKLKIMAARDLILGQSKPSPTTPADIYAHGVVTDKPVNPLVAKEAAQKARVVRNAQKARSRSGKDADGLSNAKPLPSNPRLAKFIELMSQGDAVSGTQAAKDAGYAPGSAHVQASRLLANDNIRQEINTRKAIVAEHCQIKAETIIGDAVLQAMSTIKDVVDENGHFDMGKACESGGIHQIKELTFTQTKFGENVRVVMYSRSEARRELADYLGIKQMPRENEEKLKKVVQAVRDYIADHPETDRQRVIEVFSSGRGIPAEVILEHLEMVQ